MSNQVAIGNTVEWQGVQYTVINIHKGYGNDPITAVLRDENGRITSVLASHLLEYKTPKLKAKEVRPVEIKEPEIKIEEEPEVVVEEETIEPKQEIESKPIYQRQDKRKK